VVEPGRRNLGDRYELAELIAAGGMGQVWRGTDVLLGRPVAVKVLRSEYTGDPTFRARFRAEAQHAAGLSHPNIAAVFDYGETEATDGSGETLAYLVMVLVRADGSVKITDFGIAWSAGSVPLTRTGQVIGTPQYLAPEVAEGRHAVPASDVYALGLVGYECLTGHPAFDGDNAVTIALKQVRDDPEPLPDELPRGVRTLIRRALAKDPAARIPDAAAFVAAVEDVRAGRPQPEPAPTRGIGLHPGPPPVAGPAEGPAMRTVRPPSPRRLGAAAVLVPVVTLLLGAGAAAGVFVAVSSDRGDAGPTVVAARTEDARIVLAAEDYVGRQVDEAALALSALGLLVQRVEEVTDAADPGAVTAVDPAGAQLRPGDTVRVLFAVAPAPAPRPQRERAPETWASDGRDDEEPVRAPEPEPAPTPEPVPVPEPVESSAPSAPVQDGQEAGTSPAWTGSPSESTTAEPSPTDPAPSSPARPSGPASGSSAPVDGDAEDRGRTER
jgi:serine/threonine-protein kinase